MEISNEIKAKVFAQYLEHKAKLGSGQVVTLEHNATGTLFCTIQELVLSNKGVLILQPLSQITDEDAVSVARIISDKCNKDFSVIRYKDFVLMNTHAYKMITIFFDGTMMYKDLDGVDCYTKKALLTYQFLQSKGYDLPNYLLGGKTLQETGLAIYEN